MKFLHLADLHIGKSVNNFPMLDEQRHVFKQIIDYIKKEKPNAVVIAGDIFDRPQPSVEATNVYGSLLTDLSKQKIPVMIIPGNHDSHERIGFASEIFRQSNLYLCGPYCEQLCSVTLTDELGEVNFWLLPFINPSMVRSSLKNPEIETYGDALCAVLEQAKIDFEKRNILVAHQFFAAAGVTPDQSESEINPLGGLDAIDISTVKKFDYVALGHLHGPQKVKHEHIRYAGSPLKYSFSECRHNKSASLVEIKEKGSLTITPLPLVPLHNMSEIRGTLDELTSGNGSEDYIRAILTDEDELVDPMAKLKSVYPNIMRMDYDNSRSRIDAEVITADTDRIQTLSESELFAEFFLDISGATMTQEQTKIVHELLQKSTEDGE